MAKVINLSEYRERKQSKPVDQLVVISALSWMMAFSAILMVSTIYFPGRKQ